MALNRVPCRDEVERAVTRRLEAMRGLTPREIARAAADIAAFLVDVAAGRVELGASAPAPQPAERHGPFTHVKGREMHVADVRARLPKDPNGNPPSDWYVRRVMAEVGKFRIGKWDYVYEADLERWLATRVPEDD